MNLDLYEIDDGEQQIFCAESFEEALFMYLENIVGFIPENLGEINEETLPVPLESILISKLDENYVLKIGNVDGPSGYETSSKTAFEWCLDGKGLVCSSVWC